MNETFVESSAKAVVELNEKIRVLHVDDDSGVLKITKQCLEMEAPIQVDTALSVEEALTKLEKKQFDIVVSDYQMPGKDGLDLLKTLRSKENAIPFIMFTGKGREEVAIKALNLGANQYLNKVRETETVYTELAHSITELAKTKKAEEKQCESEEKFRSLFEKANDGLVFVDVSGRIVDINQKAAELAEKRKEDIVGRSFFDLGLVSSKDLPVLVEKLRQQAIGKPTERFEFEIEKENGEKRLIEINSSFIQKNNMTIGSLSIVRDITERKQAEEALKVSEERYRNLFENSKDLKIMYDLKGNVTAVNKVAVEYGFASNEHIGKNMMEFVSKTEVPRLRKEVEEILQGKSIESEIEIDTPKGKRTLEYMASPIREKGEITGICGSYKDVTDRRKAEEALRESEERCSRLSAAALEGIGISEQGKIIDANDQLEKMMGYEPSEMIGKSVLDIVAPESRKLVMENMQKGIEGPYEHLAIRKDGSVFPVEIRARSIPYKGRTARVSAIRDVTARAGILRDTAELKQMEKKMMEVYCWTMSGNRHAGKRSMQEPHTK